MKSRHVKQRVIGLLGAAIVFFAIGIVMAVSMGQVRIGYRTVSSLAAPNDPCVMMQYCSTEELAARVESGEWDVRAECEGGRTMLHVAAYSLGPEEVRIVLDAGADTNALDAYGRRAIDLARAFGQDENVQVLAEYSGGAVE